MADSRPQEELLSTAYPLSDGLILQHGCPTNTKPNALLRRGNFLISYDHTKRIQHWVMEYLTAARLQQYYKPLRDGIREDDSLDSRFRATDEDYAGSGYDRGHMAPLTNYRVEPSLMKETNIYTNIAPQVGHGFNSNFEGNEDTHPSNWGVWARLERYVFERAAASTGAWVCTGPLFKPEVQSDGRKFITHQVIGRQNVAVASHFFKAFILVNRDGAYEIEAFIVENKRPNPVPKWVGEYSASLAEIEDWLGYELFPEKPQNVMEMACRLEGLEKKAHDKITAQMGQTPPESARKPPDDHEDESRGDPARRNLFTNGHS